MNNYCVSCGSSIPDGQRVCSMCYGDPSYGRDGYYQRFLDEQYEKYLQEQYERELYNEEQERENER